jgi:tetratricopeptide (TPR) repeat protein
MTSYGIEHNLKLVYPTRIKIRRAKLDIYGEDMKADPKVRIQYATKYAHVANYWKNFIGMSKGLKKLKVADKKRNTEEKLTQWINADPKRKEMYGEALSDIENAYKIVDNYTVSHYYFIEAIYLGPEAIKQALGYRSLLKELKAENSDQDKINKMVEALRKPMDIFYKDFNISTDKKVWAKMMQMYAADVEISQQPEYLINANKKYKGNFDKMADKVFESTIFASKEKLAVFLNNPSAKTLENDPAFIAMTSFFGKYNELKAEASSANEKLERGNRLFIDALRKMETDKKFYPDANFTMRLSYGTVKDYYPEDAVHFKYYTTLKGVMEKEDPNNPEFVVAKKLKELYLAKDYGQYGEGNTMRVCFLTNNDITGGNSGSPVINGSGQLIGLAFDGNWEAMSGDIAFEPELQRTIVVDARYVLFIIDKYAGATNLIDEMDIVKNTD